jgi:hypothetical protein
MTHAPCSGRDSVAASPPDGGSGIRGCSSIAASDRRLAALIAEQQRVERAGWFN